MCGDSWRLVWTRHLETQRLYRPSNILVVKQPSPPAAAASPQIVPPLRGSNRKGPAALRSKMAASWLLLVMAAAVFVSMVVLAAACLRCRTTVSIRQANSEESTEFRVIQHPEATVDVSAAHLPSNLLSPYSPSGDPGFQRRHQSSPLTEAGDVHSSFSESNPSYENATEEPDSTHESDVEDTGYIIVLPGEEAPLTNQSRASTPSSDVRHDYENVPNKKEDREYLNVDPQDFQRPAPGESSQSDTDDDGNYVNVHDGTRIDL